MLRGVVQGHVGRDQAAHRPVVRDLLRPGRIQPQGAAAQLRGSRRGGHGGEVDQGIHGGAVPALAEQPAGADEEAHGSRRHQGRDRGDDAPWADTGGLEVAPRSDAARTHLDGRSHVRRECGRELVCAGRRHADAVRGQQHGVQGRGQWIVHDEVVGAQRPGRGLADEPAAVAVLHEVGHDDGFDPRAVRSAQLEAEDVHRRAVLGLREGEGCLHRIPAAAESAIGEQQAEVGEGLLDVAPLLLRARIRQQPGEGEARQHGEQIVGRAALEQHGRQDRAERMLRGERAQHHAAGAREGEVVRERALERRGGGRHDDGRVEGPGGRGALGHRWFRRIRIRGLQTLLEVAHAIGGGQHLSEQGVQVLAVLADEGGLGRHRLGEPHMVAVGREMTLLHHGRGRHLEVDLAEQLRVVVELGAVCDVRQGGRESDHEAAPAALADRADEVGDDERPVIQQMMALVEDDGVDPGVHDPLQERDRVRMQHARDRLWPLPREPAPDPLHPPAQAGAVLRRVVDRELREPRLRRGLRAAAVHEFVRPPRAGERLERRPVARDAERLVGQRGQVADAQRIRRHRRGIGSERFRGARPLLADRRVRGEHERASALASGEQQSEQRLAGAGRRDDVQLGLGSGGQLRQHLRLVRAQGAREAPVPEGRISEGRGRLRHASPSVPGPSPPCGAAGSAPDSERSRRGGGARRVGGSGVDPARLRRRTGASPTCVLESGRRGRQ